MSELQATYTTAAQAPKRYRKLTYHFSAANYRRTLSVERRYRENFQKLTSLLFDEGFDFSYDPEAFTLTIPEASERLAQMIRGLQLDPYVVLPGRIEADPGWEWDRDYEPLAI